MADTLLMRARISSPDSPGGWIDLNDHRRFELASDTRKDERQGHRRREIQSPHLPGTYPVSVIPEMITSNVSVWVRGGTHHEMHDSVWLLRRAFTQLTYTMMWVVDDLVEVWSCVASDYQVSTQREYWHARIAQFNAEVARYPTIDAYGQGIPGSQAVDVSESWS